MALGKWGRALLEVKASRVIERRTGAKSQVRYYLSSD